MRFFCVTPCLNAEPYIEATIRSVLEQTAWQSDQHELTYVIQDGGSSDRTLLIAQRTLADYSLATSPHLTVQLNSNADTGMYDAIYQGFSAKSNAEIYSYINAGDYYSPHALEVVAEVFSNSFVHFLTGLAVAYNEQGHLIEAKLPQEYRKNLLVAGLYGKVLPFVQQESTFWDSHLHQKIDFEKLRQQQFAGDFYLWRTFIEIAPLYIVAAWLGGFRVHSGQLSDRFMTQYLQEVEVLAQKASALDYAQAYFEKLRKHLPERIQRRFKTQTFEYSHERKRYHLIGQQVGSANSRG